jgi:transcriptional regulator with XRE-family HTH domain
MNLCNTNNYDPAIIAEKIKKECMRQNVTVKTMLQELNTNHAALTKMTHGGAPSYITIARICDYLNISIDTLLNRPAPATPEPPDLNTAVSVVAAAAHISPDALRAVLHLPINDK